MDSGICSCNQDEGQRQFSPLKSAAYLVNTAVNETQQQQALPACSQSGVFCPLRKGAPGSHRVRPCKSHNSVFRTVKGQRSVRMIFPVQCYDKGFPSFFQDGNQSDSGMNRFNQFMSSLQAVDVRMYRPWL
ncbi:hypothetical protein BDDG_04784 [Blastomyces dermatitidis ATCC 18188]|uniref:Uncharacterized protein n=1 Tax=Ajellomyces dermatitidis (strain ATCC 18188 / CBS 674.68) TaxID=653446 RepID=F2TF28_AJEDA|nr:hypothetical protein BDDG_04784 [Blastomyces dermatitidis ATCC 18188]